MRGRGVLISDLCVGLGVHVVHQIVGFLPGSISLASDSLSLKLLSARETSDQVRPSISPWHGMDQHGAPLKVDDSLQIKNRKREE